MNVAASWRGIRTMAGLELRLRLRAGRWRWLLVAWFVLLFGFVFLLRLAVRHDTGTVIYGGADFTSVPVKRPIGTPMFGGLMLFMLGVAMLVVPALTAQSVNGDRERGVLASLQTTLLTPVQIAAGKLLAAWGTALVFLALSTPLVLWAVAEGGVGIGRAAACLAVVGLLLGVVVAVAQCLSAVLVRSTTSAVLSYLFVFALSLLTVISFALALPATGKRVTRTETYPTFDNNGNVIGSEKSTFTATETDSSKVWWLLAPNPFVVLADSAPAVAPRCDPRTGATVYEPLDPLGALGGEVRKARQGRVADDVEVVTGMRCPTRGFASGQTDAFGPTPAQVREIHPGAVWPWGLAFDVLLASGAFVVTVRRLRAPSRKLARGVRVA